MKATFLSALGSDAPRAASSASSASSVRAVAALGPKFEASLNAAQASLRAAQTSSPPRPAPASDLRTAAGLLRLAERSIELDLDDAPATAAGRLEPLSTEPTAPLAARSEGLAVSSKLESPGAAALAAVAFARNSPPPTTTAGGERPLPKEAPQTTGAPTRTAAVLGRMSSSPRPSPHEPLGPAAGAGVGAGARLGDGGGQTPAASFIASGPAEDATALEPAPGDHAERAAPSTSEPPAPTTPPAANPGATRAANAGLTRAPATSAASVSRHVEESRPLHRGPATEPIRQEPPALAQAERSPTSEARRTAGAIATAPSIHAEARAERAAPQPVRAPERAQPAPLAATAGWTTPVPAVLPATGGAVVLTAAAPSASRGAMPPRRDASTAAELPTLQASPLPRTEATPVARENTMAAIGPASAPGPVARVSSVGPFGFASPSSPIAPMSTVAAIGSASAPGPVVQVGTKGPLGSVSAASPMAPVSSTAAGGGSANAASATSLAVTLLSPAVRPSPSGSEPTAPARPTPFLANTPITPGTGGAGAVFASRSGAVFGSPSGTGTEAGATSARVPTSPRAAAPAASAFTPAALQSSAAPTATTATAGPPISATTTAPTLAVLSTAAAARPPGRSTPARLLPTIDSAPAGQAQATGHSVVAPAIGSTAPSAQPPVPRAANSARPAPGPAAAQGAADEPTSTRPAPSERPIRVRTGETEAAVLPQSGATAPFVRSTLSFDTKASDLKTPAPAARGGAVAVAQPNVAPQHTLDGIVARSKALSETLRVSTPAQPVAAGRRPAVEELTEPEAKRKAHGDEPTASPAAPAGLSTSPLAAPTSPTPAAEPSPTIPAPLEPYVTQLVEDPSAHLSLSNTSARLSVDTPEAGRLSVQLKVTDGVTDVRATGPAAPMLDARQNELRLALAQEGLSLGQFDLGQQERHRDRPEAPDAPPAPRSPRSPRATSDAVTADGRVHVKA